MKEHPILFSSPMVQANIEGRKTKTRRVLKIQPDNECYFELVFSDGVLTIDYNQGDKNPKIKSPYGKVGDILWVRETWQYIDFAGEDNGYVYKASENGKAWEQNSEEWKWKPSIFMPKAACRIRLEIINIKVERLNDISEKDAIAEGVRENICNDCLKCPSSLCKGGCVSKGEYYHYSNPMDFDLEPCYSAIESFQTLWQSINGEDSWKANPWVWVIEYKRILQ